MLTSVFHLICEIALARTYDYGAFSQVYPIARGSASATNDNSHHPYSRRMAEYSRFIQPFFIISGVLLLSWNSRRIELSKSVLWAFTTGICTAFYTVADGLGGRAAINALTFAEYQCVVMGRQSL